MTDILVAYMIDCGDTLPWNIFSLLEFIKSEIVFVWFVYSHIFVIDLCKVNSFLVFDPTLYATSGVEIINLFVCVSIDRPQSNSAPNWRRCRGGLSYLALRL